MKSEFTLNQTNFQVIRKGIVGESFRNYQRNFNLYSLYINGKLVKEFTQDSNTKYNGEFAELGNNGKNINKVIYVVWDNQKNIVLEAKCVKDAKAIKSHTSIWNQDINQGTITLIVL